MEGMCKYAFNAHIFGHTAHAKKQTMKKLNRNAKAHPPEPQGVLGLLSHGGFYTRSQSYGGI